MVKIEGESFEVETFCCVLKEGSVSLGMFFFFLGIVLFYVEFDEFSSDLDTKKHLG